MKSNSSIIIIGAGVAGLATGCYAQINGFKSKIFEMHSLPGGLCTSWSRKGYTFDGCIQWLVGSNPKSPSHQPWKELGALEGKTIYDQEEFTRVEVGGQTLIVYTNVDRFENELVSISPEDHKVIKEFTDGIRALSAMNMPIDIPDGVLKSVKMAANALPGMPVMLKWNKVTVSEYTARIKNPFLKVALPLIIGINVPMIGLMYMLAWMNNKDAGYPLGGSLEFSRAIEKRYLDLGGEIYYKARVNKILVENNAAVGISLTDGSVHCADQIVSAADGHATIFDMLDGKYINDTIQGYYNEFPIFQPIVQVSLGVDQNLSGQPSSVSFPLEKPISVAGVDRPRMGYKLYNFDPTLAPAGKSMLSVMFESNYAYWKAIAEDNERYEAEKKSIAIQVIDQLDKRFPGLSNRIEVVDVATPLTTERYTGNWQGSIEGWMLTSKTMKMMFGKGMDKTLPGLKNFYMVGQWVEPGGGLPTAAISGRKLVRRLCQEAKKPFLTEPAG